jgi:hypothetical protein
MGDKAITAVVSILTALIGVAILSILVSPASNTANVIKAGAGGFQCALATALSPVTGGVNSGLAGLLGGGNCGVSSGISGTGSGTCTGLGFSGLGC